MTLLYSCLRAWRLEGRRGGRAGSPSASTSTSTSTSDASKLKNCQWYSLLTADTPKVHTDWLLSRPSLRCPQLIESNGGAEWSSSIRPHRAEP
ncbi:unnamed protein product [Pleuronectes platessa]|uniref:Uncharacterized protein n=1 Tax=Pleuronectes platessa TaxID=8262 RepID=A0A9N7TX97_PLEPL|nr:unnamed protein product [Pleuronectes platessa]